MDITDEQLARLQDACHRVLKAIEALWRAIVDAARHVVRALRHWSITSGMYPWLARLSKRQTGRRRETEMTKKIRQYARIKESTVRNPRLKASNL